MREVVLIRSLVHQLVAGLNARDPSTCTRLFSQHLLRGTQRAESVARCRRRVAATDAKVDLANIELVNVSRTPRSTSAVVQFVTTTVEGRRQRHRFHLIRDGESYKVDGVYRVRQP